MIQRRAYLARSTKPILRTAVKRNRKKEAARLLRTHGPVAFRKWIHGEACAACGVVGFSVAAHVQGNGGTGRKRSWKTVTALCLTRVVPIVTNGVLRPLEIAGCHERFDDQTKRPALLAQYPHFTPERAAAETQARYLTHCRQEQEGT